MVVLKKALKAVHEGTGSCDPPSGEAVAMVHCNNCTSDLNAWVGLFKEIAESRGSLWIGMNCTASCTGKPWKAKGLWRNGFLQLRVQ